MKGIIQLKSIGALKEGMKVIYESQKGYSIGIAKYIEKDEIFLEGGNEWLDLRFEKEELFQLIVEYKCPSIKREGESCPKNNNCKYPECSILPIPENDWERNIGRIGEEVEFVKWDGGRQCIGEPEIQPVAWIQESIPSPILYTEEEVEKILLRFCIDIARNNNQIPNAQQLKDYWLQHKKK
jgi:hypothetical protein